MQGEDTEVEMEVETAVEKAVDTVVETAAVATEELLATGAKTTGAAAEYKQAVEVMAVVTAEALVVVPDMETD